MSHQPAAVIVVYQPVREPLLRLLQAIADDTARIYLFLNSRIEPDFLADCAAAAQPSLLQTLGDGTNVGLGRAYNEAAAAARAAGCDRLLLFDQDSLPSPGIAGRLAAGLDAAERHFPAVAVIGPKPEPPDLAANIATKTHGAPPPRSPSRLVDVAFLISSGSLIPLTALAQIGPFREDFFIDAIDIEWCFRARAGGFRCVMARDERMIHRVGTGALALPVLHLRLSDQPPARLFTFARNQTAMLRLSHVPLWWKARVSALTVLRLLLAIILRRRPAETALLRGIRAGWRGELGLPE